MAANTNKMKDELTADEVNRYFDAYFATVDTLFNAQGKLKSLEDKAADLGERSGFRSDRLRVEADIELMRAKRIAFNANRSPITPPDQGTVDQVVKLTGKVAALTVVRRQAQAIVQLAAEATERFKKIQNA